MQIQVLGAIAALMTFFKLQGLLSQQLQLSQQLSQRPQTCSKTTNSWAAIAAALKFGNNLCLRCYGSSQGYWWTSYVIPCAIAAAIQTMSVTYTAIAAANQLFATHRPCYRSSFDYSWCYRSILYMIYNFCYCSIFGFLPCTHLRFLTQQPSKKNDLPS